jgi:hypothetical protein
MSLNVPTRQSRRAFINLLARGGAGSVLALSVGLLSAAESDPSNCKNCPTDGVADLPALRSFETSDSGHAVTDGLHAGKYLLNGIFVNLPVPATSTQT